MKNQVFIAAAALALAACGDRTASAPAASDEAATAASEVADAPAPEPTEAAVDLAAARTGLYVPDPNHRHILFSYDHKGYSTPYVRWRDWTADLNWNAEDPEASTVSVTIESASVDSGVEVFNGHLSGERFFDVANYPQITFVSTALTRTGPNSGTMIGDLTIKGVTKPVPLDVVLNNAAFEEQPKLYKIGFSAGGTIKRSEFGLDFAVPFVSDDVNLIIEAEFQSSDAPAVE